MRIGTGSFTDQAMVAEQAAEPGSGHGASALGPFEGDEQIGRVGERTFQPDIVLENLDEFAGQGQDASLAAFTQGRDLGVSQVQIFQLQPQHFAGAQAIQQHEARQREVAEGAETGPKLGHLFRRKRYNHAARFS